MKKIAFLISAIFCVAFANAATINWTVNAVDVSLVGGTAYLLDISDYGKGVSDIANYIIANGFTTPSETKIANVGDASVADFGGGYYGVNPIDSTATFATGDAFCVIIVDSTQNSFFITNVMNAEADPLLGNWTAEWNPDWDPTYWDTVGAVSGSVPEPTALALLALGVAGVALRRRKMA